MRQKRLKLDQAKIDVAKKFFGVDSDQEAVSRALSLIADETKITEGLKPLAGSLKGDRRPWPYT